MAASLVNLLGFTTGAILYAMLFWMVLRSSSDRLSLLTGALGLCWNVGAFSGYGLYTLGLLGPSPLLMAIAFSALGFLPAVVVHSVLRSRTLPGTTSARLFLGVAYCLSFAAGVLHLLSALFRRTAPSQSALLILTGGFAVVMVALLFYTRREAGWRQSIWVVSLAVFAVSTLHLSNHQGTDPWWLELIGHHSSVPLALAFLHQDYRFALADIFLKRAVALVLLVTLVFGFYVSGPTPPTDQRSILILLAMWVVTALVYPWIRSLASWFVDNVVLRRPDYDMLFAEASRTIGREETAESILGELCQLLRPALSARSIQWRKMEDAAVSLTQNIVTVSGGTAAALIPTVDAPQYALTISELEGGRRLLSDDIAAIERLTLLTARRIDVVRATQERFERNVREQEMRKLAAEAELRALRAQLNPHFLFNALTTIGYLIQTSPERALGTLMRLSSLLRSVLRSGNDFSTLGEELKLIEAYLEIEGARFEDRLSVRIDVAEELRGFKLPGLLLQPLVENAIKHGISKSVAGGEVRITASLASTRNNRRALRLVVEDSGSGGADLQFYAGRAAGVGLNSVEKRLRHSGNDEASMTVQSEPGKGTRVELILPSDAGWEPEPTAELVHKGKVQ